MARNEIRPIIKLKSTAGTGYTYVTRKTIDRIGIEAAVAQIRARGERI